MNLLQESLSLPLIVAGWLLYIVVVMWAFKTAPWHKINGDSAAQNVLLGATVAVFFLWQFAASLGGGITFHFLFMTVLTLMFAPQFAVLGMSLVMIGVTFNEQLGWWGFGLNAVLMGVVPIVITSLMLRFANHYLEANFFVYVFFNAFLAASMSALVVLSLGGWVLWVSDAYTLAFLKQSFIPFIPLMAMPEGLVNGFVMAWLLLFKPQWVSSFQGKV